jgi:hypothetical protein
MTLYVGEAITVRCDALNPISGAVIDDALAHVEFYNPLKNPIKVPEDRVPDKGPFEMVFDPANSAYVGYVDTSGWTPGKWTYRVTLSGVYESWEYATFRLVA